MIFRGATVLHIKGLGLILMKGITNQEEIG